jgi:uncharacterized protein
VTVPERDFQVFVKPVSSVCDLACRYCYYSGKAAGVGDGTPLRMEDDLLESYIGQHIAAATDEIIRFSWHGGEPTLAGLDFFRRAVAFQRKHCPTGRTIRNGLQTNGVGLDDDWGRFLAEEGFSVGISLDGPARFHDAFRLGRDGRPTHARAMRGYEVLKRHGVATDVLCVVHAGNEGYPSEVYGFFKSIGAAYITFLPLVEKDPARPGRATPESVPAEAWGAFLRAVFDEWVAADIGRLKVQIFEEAARTAFGQDHSLCIFRPVCGGIPVVERNGDFYPCDHYVRPELKLGNVREMPLADLVDGQAQRAFGSAKYQTLPRSCRECPVLSMCNGECPKNRFLSAPDGEPGLNYLCAGYKGFFLHARPFVEAIAAAWRRGRTDSGNASTGGIEAVRKPGASRIPGRKNRPRRIRS